MWGVRFFSSILSLLAMAAASSFLTGCANFKLLGKDLDLIDRTYVVTGQIRNAGQFPNVYGVITEWENGTTGKVESADFTTIGNVGVFGFLVERKRDQYLFDGMAFCHRQKRLHVISELLNLDGHQLYWRSCPTRISL